MNKTITVKRKSSVNVGSMTMTGLLAAVTYVIAFIEIPVLLTHSFARMDVSGHPALIAIKSFPI